MTINIEDLHNEQKVELSIDDGSIYFEWKDENNIFQEFDFSLSELKKAIKFLEDDKKRA